MYRRIFALFALAAFAISACNLPSDQGGTEEVDDLALTITAQALILQQPGGGDPGQGQQPGGGEPAFTATPQFTATPGPTSTPSVPQITVSVNTNCRTGPGVVYDLIDSLLVGQTGEIVGKNSGVPNYWVIKRLNGSGTCWLWGQYATVTGNTSNLPEYPVPPTPTPTKTATPTATSTFTPTPTLAPPAAVDNVAVAKVCIPLVLPIYNYTGNMTWQDKSNNEDGFNIYFNGALFTTLPANSTSFPIPPLPFAAGTPAKWGVEAYNAAGKAAIKDTTFFCP
ncbi:MAG: hypothetical protein DYG86_06060 [Chloroflexi bacterium CFX2]|nr:hypothetical protein [Chloroflexi bacterium CFX2]